MLVFLIICLYTLCASMCICVPLCALAMGSIIITVVMITIIVQRFFIISVDRHTIVTPPVNHRNCTISIIAKGNIY